MTEEKKVLEAMLKDSQDATKKIADKLEAIRRDEEEKSLVPLRDAARRAHDLLCPFNHTDGCSWGYEGDSWRGAEHVNWLRKVNRLVNGDSVTRGRFTIDQINVTLDAVEKLKKIVPTAMDLIRRGFN